MPARLVISPVVLQNGVRRPKVATLEDPGRTAEIGEFAELVHSSVISDGNGTPGQQDDICLSLVGGLDMTELDADPEVISLFEMPDATLDSIMALMDQTPDVLGWPGNIRNRLTRRLAQRGADTTGLDKNSTLGEYFDRLAAAITGVSHNVRGLRTRRGGV